MLALFAIWAAWKLSDNKRRRQADSEQSQVERAFVPVETTFPRREALSTNLTADGIFLPSKEMLVISETAGRVLQLYKNRGDAVREGDLIAKIDDELARIELEATEATLAKLHKDRDRLTSLIEGEAVPKSKIEEVQLGIATAEAKQKALKKQIANTSIRAPMTGILGMRFIERGSVIGPGIQVGQITDLDKLLLVVKVPENDVLHLRKGLSVDVLPDVFPDQTLRGAVTNIGLRADNAFNYDVEITVDNPRGQPLRGGMHAKARFHHDSGRQGLTLPRRAIAGSLQEGKAFVVMGDTAVRERRLQLGAVFGDRVEVTGGLTTADQIVLNGQVNLSDGARIRVTQRRDSTAAGQR